MGVFGSGCVCSQLDFIVLVRLQLPLFVACCCCCYPPTAVAVVIVVAVVLDFLIVVVVVISEAQTNVA